MRLFVCQKVSKYEHIYQKRSNVTFDKEKRFEILQEITMKANVIIFVLMAMFGEVPQPEVDQACEESEVALERAQIWTPRLHQGFACKKSYDDIRLWQATRTW